jgi:hypothetical protein
MREVTLRHIHPGGLDNILEPLLDRIREAGVNVARVYTVPEIDVYTEGVLPPVVTVFCDMDLLLGEPAFVDLAALGVQEVVDRYKSMRLNGHTTANGEFLEASDLGVFVTIGGAIAKYYVKPNDFSAEALQGIRGTLGSTALAESLSHSESPLGTIILWAQGHWQLFVSGGNEMIRLTDGPGQKRG